MTETRTDIADAAERMHRQGLSQQVQKLPTHLERDESVDCMAPARVTISGLLVVTDRRVVFVKDGFISEKYSLPLDKIASIHVKSRKRVVFILPERAIKITFTRKTDLQPLVDHIRSRTK